MTERTIEFTATELTYWIAHGSALATGYLEAGEGVSTGQPEFETFAGYRPYISRWCELGGDPEGAPKAHAPSAPEDEE